MYHVYHISTRTQYAPMNYKQAIVEEESYPATCNSTNYDNTFIDGHHKRVFTGNLAIAGNKTLKDLLSKGLNFRGPRPPHKKKAYESIISALDTYVHNTVNDRLSAAALIKVFRFLGAALIRLRRLF